MLPLLKLKDENAYRKHYMQTVCIPRIETFDGIRVYFKSDRFGHAFFESSDKRGAKDVFSLARAERMDWIAVALADQNALCLQGRVGKTYSPLRRVTVVEDFIIVISLKQPKNGELIANFVTCFWGDNSAPKIRRYPKWTRDAFDSAT